MVIPKREYYDIEGASDYLGVSQSDVWYYIKEDSLRLAFEPVSDGFYIVKKSVPKARRLLDPFEIERNKFTGDYSETLPKVTLNPTDLSGAELEFSNYLYVLWSNLEETYDGKFGSFIFENLRGDEVNPWFQISPAHYTKDLSEMKLVLAYETFTDKGKEFPKGLCLTFDKLKRFGDPEVGAELAFVEPAKPDGIAIAMVSFGNRFLTDKGHIPTPMELAGYMLDTGKTELQLMYDPRGQDYIFGDKPLSKRAFSDRYKKYKRV